MYRSIDVRRLEQFVAVAREGSLGKAATQLGLSQPTLTRNIRSLEAEVGTKLFERGPLGTVMTPVGRRFLPRAESIILDVERAVSELGDTGANAHLRVGVSPNFFFDVLPRAIGMLIGEDPGMNLHTSSGTRETIAEDLRRGVIDLGICLIPDFFLTGETETSEIEFEPFGRERVLPYARPGHPALAAETLAEVVECRWVVPHQLSVSYRFESAFFRHHLRVPVQSLNSASLSLIRYAAAEEDMVALLPERFAAPDVAAGRLVALRVDALVFEFSMGTMKRAGVPLLPAAINLIDAMRSLVDGEGAPRRQTSHSR